MADPRGSPTSPARRPRVPVEARTIRVVVRGPITPSDVPGLWDRACLLLEGSAAYMVDCDVAGVVEADIATVDALARLQLRARRSGRLIRLDRACAELEDLLALVGLHEVVPLATGLLLEPRGQAEEREQLGGVQEEADPGDPIA